MIPTEKLVITVEQAKKLEELGIEQDAHFYWARYESSEWHVVDKGTRDFYEGMDETYAAFTIGELIIMTSHFTKEYEYSDRDELYKDVEFLAKSWKALPIINEIIKTGEYGNK